MNYAGFWRRLLAGLVDSLVFVPVMIAFYWLSNLSQTAAAAAALLGSAPFFAYQLWFNANKGQTLGKMVAKVRILKTDGSKIGWREAVLRCCVDMALNVVIAVGMTIATLSVPEDVFAAGLNLKYLSKEWLDFQQEITQYNPFPNWLIFAASAWTWSELLFLFFNKRKRALHDYIAGTVVVRDA